MSTQMNLVQAIVSIPVKEAAQNTPVFTNPPNHSIPRWFPKPMQTYVHDPCKR